jgi:hypothetical protein
MRYFRIAPSYGLCRIEGKYGEWKANLHAKLAPHWGLRLYAEQ